MPDEPNLPNFPPLRNDADRLKGAELPPPESGDGLPPRWDANGRRGGLGGLIRVLLLSVVLALLVIPFTPLAGKIKRGITGWIEKWNQTRVVEREVPKEIIKEVTKEVIKEVPRLEPLPEKFVPRKDTDVASLFNGITIETKLETTEGTYASLEVGNADAYKVKFQVSLHVPKANQTPAELARLNEHLPKMFPQLPSLLETGKVSGFYHKLYENKVSGVEKNITRLSKLLDRHNFFDCETILELQHPTTKRRALLIQSEMDVVADGSDGDRMPEMAAGIYESNYYQPFTSYDWVKKNAESPNPLLAKWKARNEALKKEAAQKGISTARKNELKAQMQHLDTEMKAMKSRSSLIGEKDPFIVISLLFKDYPRISPHAPSLGDYCAVIHGDKILPAICGDYGPSMKMGEASLLIAKKINEKATPNNRGEDDLKVTYLIFPGTAEKVKGPPNLDTWNANVTQYLKELGGLGEGYSVYKWDDPFPKKQLPPVVATETPKPEGDKPGTTGAAATVPEVVRPAAPAAQQ